MKVKSWHISTISIVIVFVLFFFLSSIGAVGLSALMILALLPALVWWGWTLHARSLYMTAEIEQRVMNRLRKVDKNDIVAKRSKAS